jgi:hypothetical protein
MEENEKKKDFHWAVWTVLSLVCLYLLIPTALYLELFIFKTFHIYVFLTMLAPSSFWEMVYLPVIPLFEFLVKFLEI